MKKITVMLSLLLWIPWNFAYAVRKPWPRRPGVVLYELKMGATLTDRATLAHTLTAQANTTGRDEEDLAEDLLKTGAVLYAEPDYLMPVAAIPNDPGFPSQWYHSAIHSSQAWDITTGAASVVVAVCDTGIDAGHPDLAANLSLPGYNTASGTTDTTPVADHGTAVAGVIDALGNNATGGAGVAWNVKILPVRVSDNADGSAWCSSMASGISWAADHGAKVINLSYDVTGCPHTIDSAAQYAKTKGAVTFVAAGNSGINLSGDFPAAHSFILVGATDSSGQRASFSNYGSPLDLVAPGASIYVPFPKNTYGYASGTSFSAPISAGIAALLFSVNSAWTPDQIRVLLLATAQSANVMNGYGQVDAAGSLAAAKTVMAGGAFPSLPGSPGTTAAQAIANLNGVLVFPNPWRADRHAGNPVLFDQLTGGSTVKIFTVSGYRVRTLTPVSGQAAWDLKNDSGDDAASGLYLFSVTDDQGNNAQGKFSIVR